MDFKFSMPFTFLSAEMPYRGGSEGQVHDSLREPHLSVCHSGAHLYSGYSSYSQSSKYVLYNVPQGSGSLTHEEVSLSLVALPRLLPGPLWRRSVLAGCQGSVCSRLHPRMSAVC